ncbi:siphovirus Gp157 family protein [Eikenella sp. Marseille-P7795]|uniref:siphovirus Gp157 family protein n=1 Tax=Eikenella sp. Marseille-P7795 TaxID=2866577 RepID=UPI001CE3E028|nr:siphovirus Gp157 family protein [Eikenella sp. Marseille-P7795]
MQVTLYQCADDIRAVLDTHFDNETEAADTLEAVIGQFEVKAQAVTAYWLNQEAQISLLDQHIKSMQEKKKVLQNRQGRLKSYLAANMKRSGIREIKADDGTFTSKFQKNPPAVTVYDEKQIPEEYWVAKKEISKSVLKEAIKSGKEIPGVKLESSESLRIK